MINAKRMRVLTNAARLFAVRGFHETSVHDIARSLKLTKGSIYYYIPSKEQILFQVHDHALDLLLDRAAVIARSTDQPDVKLHRIITTHILTCVSEMSVVAALLQLQFALTGVARARIVAKRDRYDKVIRDIIKEGIDRGLFIQCDPVMVTFFTLGFINYIPHWYKQSGRLSREAIAKLFADLMLRSISVEQKRWVSGRRGEHANEAPLTRVPASGRRKSVSRSAKRHTRAHPRT